jgi:hypothetical protein
MSDIMNDEIDCSSLDGEEEDFLTLGRELMIELMHVIPEMSKEDYVCFDELRQTIILEKGFTENDFEDIDELYEKYIERD